MMPGRDRGTKLTYPDRGLTRIGCAPEGYRISRRRIDVGFGKEAFGRLAEGILSWQLHRLAGLTVQADAPRALPGIRVVSGFGIGPLRIRAPCQVIWVEEDSGRAGFGYGTLDGHPESGEESFRAVLEADGRVCFELFAYSRHANWFYTLGAPVATYCQQLVTGRYLSAARRLAG